MVVVLSDAKQVLAVFLLSLLGICLLRIRDARKAALYAAFATLSLASLWLAREMFPLLPVLLDEALVRRGLEQKLAIGPLIVSHYDSTGHWLFGLGPGHSVGRLASLLPDYYAHLAPLGATLSSVTSQALALQESNFVSSTETGSSVWSPFFFWAGLWGDLGLLGLTSYLLLWLVVWRRLCVSELSRFLVLTILAFGSVFSWLEEPAYMLFVTATLGLEWQIWRCRCGVGGPVGQATSPLAVSSTGASAASRSRVATGSRLRDPGLRSP
jgi:hypothetical protein